MEILIVWRIFLNTQYLSSQFFRFRRRLNTKHLIQHGAALVIHSQDLRLQPELVIADHEMLIELLSRSIYLKTPLENLNSLVPLPGALKVFAISRNKENKFSPEALAFGSSAQFIGLMG